MTMEFEKLIEERRSIRKYDSSRRAAKEQITAMVQAANSGTLLEKQPDCTLLRYFRGSKV